MDGTSIEAVLYCIREFQETANEITFNTGDKLFTNFRCTPLRGAVKDDWDSVIAPIQHRTPATFHVALNVGSLK
jgi:hypothetical protein